MSDYNLKNDEFDEGLSAVDIILCIFGSVDSESRLVEQDDISDLQFRKFLNILKREGFIYF